MPHKSPVPAVLALAVFALALFAPQIQGDGDTLWHIVTGNWILANGAIPQADPFSLTFAGAPWTAHEWLSEVLMAGAFNLAGLGGVFILTAAAAGAAVLVVGHRLARDLDGLALFVVLLLSVGLFSPGFLARPHLLALPALALWVSALLLARDENRTPAIWTLPLMTLWANLHGGYMFGLALIGPFALEALIGAKPDERMRVVLGWGGFGLAALGAALVTPNGTEGLLFPFKLLSISSLSAISEWQAAEFSGIEPMEIALVALLFLALWRPVQVPLLRLAILILLVHMSLSHVRHQILLGIIAPMLLAGPIADSIGRAKAIKLPALWQLVHPAIACAAVALVGLRLWQPAMLVESMTKPVAALAAVPVALRQRPVMNDYAFGGFLIWNNIRPYIDSRADMYGDAFLTRYDKIVHQTGGGLEEELGRFNIEWTMFAPAQPIVAALDKLTGWQRIYAGQFAVVHARVKLSTTGQMQLRSALD